MNYTHEYNHGPGTSPRPALLTGEKSADGRVWVILVASVQPVPQDWITRVDDSHVKRLVDPKHLRKIGGQ